MRVSTALNRVLGLAVESLIGVRFDHDGVIVTVRLRRRRRVCSGCGQLCGHARHAQLPLTPSIWVRSAAMWSARCGA